MSVLVFAENVEGGFKKATLEAVSYAKAIAGGDQVVAVVTGTMDSATAASLGKYGAAKVMHYSSSNFNTLDAAAFAKAIENAATSVGATKVVIANTYTGKSIAPRVAVRLKAALIPGAVALPAGNGSIKRSVFSNKGFADVQANAGAHVISLTPNSYMVNEGGSDCAVETVSFDAAKSVNQVEVKKAGGKIALTEAEIVVSGGRGMKGPENWHLIEKLADTLGAATACSKPVSDVHWRPHSEHVGQTGITIKPNLYFAIGISGAIQHLAGVSSSKVIVAINTDKEAPFFKIADYGVVGDALEVLPRLQAAVEKFQANH